MHSPFEEPALQSLDDAAIALRIVAAAPGVDEEAETELCRRFAPRVRLYGLKHLRNSAAAADLVQDVLIIALKGLRSAKVRKPERLASFVLGTCRQLVVDQRRTQQRRERLLNHFAAAVPDRDASLAPSLDLALLKHCLEGLQERERTVVLSSFYDERPSGEVAQELGLSATNVRVIRHRSLAKLQGCMGFGDAGASFTPGEAS